MMLKISVIVILAWLQTCSAHVVLTYPPARKYPLDFLDNLRTILPCGMPCGLGPETDFKAGSKVTVHWHIAYTHKVIFYIDILDKREKSVARYTLFDMDKKLNGGTAEAPETSSESHTTAEPKSTESIALQYAITLPDTVCYNCTLRLELEMTSYPLTFHSCADVNIVNNKVVDYRAKCSQHGNFKDDGCFCDRLYTGERCQFKNDCDGSSDCSNNGVCEDTKSTSYPRMQCYCDIGYFGTKCEKRSKVIHKSIDYDLYTTRNLSEEIDLYYRVVEDEAELEVVMKVKSSTWVAVGFRPQSYRSGCQLFPIVPQPGDKLSDKSTGNPTAMPEAAPGTTSVRATATTTTAAPDGEPSSGPKVGIQSGNVRKATDGGQPHAMDCADIVVGSAKGSRSRVGDYYTRDRSTPLRDELYGGTDDLTAALGFEENGYTIILFRKKLTVTDVTDYSIQDGPMHVIWARGQDTGKYVNFLEVNRTSDLSYYREDELKYHGRTTNNKGVVILNFRGQTPPDHTDTMWLSVLEHVVIGVSVAFCVIGIIVIIFKMRETRMMKFTLKPDRPNGNGS